MNKVRYFLFLMAVFAIFQSCNSDVVVDTFEEIPNQNWTYTKPIKAKLNVTDHSKAYQINVQFRHTLDYKYANVWLRFHIIGPDKKAIIERQEFQLALPNGEWLGKGSGSLYSYELVFKDNYKFNQNGNYTIMVEQNMRDNPLAGVNDVGLKIMLVP
jgi:gliding motility-associated lipoprotein GldH